jgi:hypothetical protein
LETIGLLDGVLRFARRHVDECESSRPAGFPVIDEFDGFDFAVALENCADFVFGCGEWQVANVDRRHSTNLTDRSFNIQTPARAAASSSVPSAIH